MYGHSVPVEPLFSRNAFYLHLQDCKDLSLHVKNITFKLFTNRRRQRSWPIIWVVPVWWRLKKPWYQICRWPSYLPVSQTAVIKWNHRSTYISVYFNSFQCLGYSHAYYYYHRQKSVLRWVFSLIFPRSLATCYLAAIKHVHYAQNASTLSSSLTFI